MHRLLASIVSVLALVIGVAPMANAASFDNQVFSETAIADSPFKESPTLSQSKKQEVVAATNAFRLRNVRKPLRSNKAMDVVAQRWAKHLSRVGALSHNPNYSSQIPDGWTRAGENVLQNYPSASGIDIVRQWENSPGHRRNMLRQEYTDLGVGIAISSDGKLWAVQVFAAY